MSKQVLYKTEPERVLFYFENILKKVCFPVLSATSYTALLVNRKMRDWHLPYIRHIYHSPAFSVYSCVYILYIWRQQLLVCATCNFRLK